MKLPKKFNKMNNEDHRKWVADRLKIIRYEEEQLTKLLRLLVRDEKITLLDEFGGLDYELNG